MHQSFSSGIDKIWGRRIKSVGFRDRVMKRSAAVRQAQPLSARESLGVTRPDIGYRVSGVDIGYRGLIFLPRNWLGWMSPASFWAGGPWGYGI